MGFLAWIVVGLIAGWLAGQVMKGGGYGVLDPRLLRCRDDAQQFERTCTVGLASLSRSNRSNQPDSREKCLGLCGQSLALYRSEDASKPKGTGFCEDH